jgi:hypothetical protein
MIKTWMLMKSSQRIKTTGGKKVPKPMVITVSMAQINAVFPNFLIDGLNKLGRPGPDCSK